MMTKGSRILVLLAALAMGLVYVLPVWRITLDAPQYPEGLGMVIRVNTIVGVKQHDLNNINNLNHYIGMKRIDPESVPTLKIMPVVIGALMLLGVLTAALGRRKLLFAFAGLFLALSLAGMADFWRWNYDYGHNLDNENAIIKIPGMSYQPPLIGSRQILNFTAHSWPASGGWILILAGGVFSVMSVLEFRGKGRRKDGGERPGPTDGTVAPAALALLLGATLAASACSDPQPRALVYGSDACESCLMGVADEGHGAEMVTETGKAYVFDSIECMAAFLRSMDDPGVVHSLWVTDFSQRPELVRTEDAYFLASRTLQSPMGLGLTAFGRAEDRDGAVHSFGGEPLDWDGVRALVAEKWPNDRPAHGGHSETMSPDGHGT